MDKTYAAALLNKPGGVIILPTDTLYGLVARANDEAAVKRLYALKGRIDKPGTLIAANIDQIVGLGIKRRYLVAVEQYWPGAVSVVVPCADPKLNFLTLGVGSLAVRVPKDDSLCEILSKTGPLLTSSANYPGEPPAVNVTQAREYFNGNVDAIIDGGDYSGRESSTVIRVIDDAVEVLREGAVKIRDK